MKIKVIYKYNYIEIIFKKSKSNIETIKNTIVKVIDKIGKLFPFFLAISLE